MKELRKYWVDRSDGPAVLMRYDVPANGITDNAHVNLWAQVELLQEQNAAQTQELDRLRAACAEWQEAVDAIRDRVLNERDAMAEMDFGNDRVNAVLSIIDDVMPCAPLGQPLLDERDKLKRALRGLRDELREYNPTDLDLTAADAALAGVDELSKEAGK